MSIVLPCFNAAQYLEDALYALGRQTVTDFEVIVVDDGSTDATSTIIRLAAERDRRIRSIALTENEGVTAAREAAVRAARSPWVWMVDADDAWPDDALALLLSHSEGADIVVAAASYRYENGSTRALATPRLERSSGRDALAALLVGEVKGHLWNKLFRTELLLGLSFTRSRVHSDLSMVAEALAAAYSVRYTDGVVYYYQVRTGSIITSNSKRARSLDTVARVVSNAVQELADPDLERRHRYFTHRFILLSAIKDAGNPSYTSAERAGLLRSIRGRLQWRGVTVFVRRREVRRAALVLAVKCSQPFSTRLARALFRR